MSESAIAFHALLAFITQALDPRSLLSVSSLLCLTCTVLLIWQAWIFKDCRTLLLLLAASLALGSAASAGAVIYFDDGGLNHTLYSLVPGGASYFVGSICLVYLISNRFEWKTYSVAGCIGLLGFLVWPTDAAARAWNLGVEWGYSAIGLWFVWRAQSLGLRSMRRTVLIVAVMSVIGLTPGMLEMAADLIAYGEATLPLDTPTYRQRTLLWAISPLVLYACVMAVIHGRWASDLRMLAERDDLTGLYTRPRLYAFVEAALAAPPRTAAPRYVGLLMVDLDHFKSINDACGHAGGDTVLRHCASVLAREVGAARGIVARFGGEEFCVAIVTEDSAEPEAIARRVLAALNREAIAVRPGQVQVSASIGVAVMPVGTPVQSLLAAADAHLYRAKHGGRNRIDTGPAGMGPPGAAVSCAA